ncbi:MAG: fasciclin domain-containing protein [Actinomycetota bacterium]
MSPAIEHHQRRYRRRIIGLGAVLFVLTFLIPAPFVIDWVEDDLEDRVGDELDAAGLTGVSITFSGQDGTLECDEPLADAAAVEALALDEWGVRTLDLDRSCRPAAAEADPVDDTTAPSTVASTTVAPTTTTAPTTTVPEPELDSIATLVGDDPQFSQLAGLLASTGLDRTLGGDGPFTVFAPTDAAFDAAFEALGSDAFVALTSNDALVERVLLGHVTSGRVASSDLASGDLEMLDGSTVVVDVDEDSPTLTSGGVVARPDPDQLDIEGSNGLVHAIDQVLLPSDLDLGLAEPDPQVVAELVDGRFILIGTVASEAQREALLAALEGRVDPSNIDDQLVVDAEDPSAVADADVDRFARVLDSMPANLVSGMATLTGSDLAVSGVTLGDDELAALQALGDELDADAELTVRADADEASAQALEDELNEFVRLNPITFEPNSADLTAEAVGIVEQVAARAQTLGGVTIAIVGHTDSDGQPDTNQQLSELRAAAVLAALTGEGLDPATLSSEGRGQSEPILVDGVEDKDASRRVEFVVAVQPT